MSLMSIPYEEGGRTAQKRRTRAALVAAARDMVAAGVTPTVDETASVASISRTTAYRYFPNLRALLVAAYPHGALVPATTPGQPPEVWAHLYRDFRIADGRIQLTQKPGLGLELDEDFLARYQTAVIEGRST